MHFTKMGAPIFESDSDVRFIEKNKSPMNNSMSTMIDEKYTNGLGRFVFQHHEGSFALTPASKIALKAVYQNQHLLAGKGIDWGCGTGCLAITAARIEKVSQVMGLDISEENIREARQNIRDNNVEGKVEVELSDSYAPKTLSGHRKLEAFKKQTQFILANPPSSEGDDGFEFRRIVLRNARVFLQERGVVFLNISCQYGKKRIERSGKSPLSKWQTHSFHFKGAE
jgi:methylase of polypeptide subunit release factors